MTVLRFRIGALALAVTALVMLGASVAGAADQQKRILVVSHTNGFRHSSIPTAEKVLGDLAAKSDWFVVDYCRTQDDVIKMLTPEFLESYDGVFFANTTGNLKIPDLHAFLKWIWQGKAFFGAHSAADTYRAETVGGDTSFVDMLGGEFKTHGAQCEVACIVEDTFHPSVTHLGKVWNIFDEIYLFTQNNRDKVHVLLYLDKHPNDGAANAGEPGDYLISWTKRHGMGKVFYTALGHREDVWENPKFQEHVLGGMKWALGLEKGVATAGPKR